MLITFLQLDIMSDNKEIKEVLEEMLGNFKEKLADDEKLQKKLEGFNRAVSVEFSDDGNYNFKIKDQELSDIKEGALDDAEITIKTDTETFQAVVSGDMKPMEAYARKKIKVDASFLDILKIKDIF